MSITLSHLNRCSDYNGICNGDSLILVKGHRLHFIAITDIHAGRVADKCQQLYIITHRINTIFTKYSQIYKVRFCKIFPFTYLTKRFFQGKVEHILATSFVNVGLLQFTLLFSEHTYLHSKACSIKQPVTIPFLRGLFLLTHFQLKFDKLEFTRGTTVFKVFSFKNMKCGKPHHISQYC